MLPKPYFGQDIEDVQQRCIDSLDEHFRSVPREDISTFNPSVRQYGKVWAETCDKVDGVFVIAGVSGNMTGVPIAMFEYQHRDAAKAYAAAFEQGKVFAIFNGERWRAYVKAAHKVKSLNADDLQSLISMGRASGITANGVEIGRGELLEFFVNGGRF